MMQNGEPKHPMKMVAQSNRELQANVRRHEHGMDRERDLDEFPRA